MAGWNALLHGRPKMVHVSSLPRTKLLASWLREARLLQQAANGSYLPDLDAGAPGTQTSAPLAAGTFENGATFRVEGIRIAQQWHLRLVVSDVDGERAAAWSALPLTRTNAMFAIVPHDAHGSTLLLIGAEQDIEMILAAQGQPTLVAPKDVSVH